MRKTRTTPYRPQSDGLVERFNKTVLDMLSMAVQQDEDKWDLIWFTKPAPASLDQCDDLLPDETIPKESTPV